MVAYAYSASTEEDPWNLMTSLLVPVNQTRLTAPEEQHPRLMLDLYTQKENILKIRFYIPLSL